MNARDGMPDVSAAGDSGGPIPDAACRPSRIHHTGPMSWWKRDKSEPTAAPAPAELPEWTEPPTDIDDFRDRLEAVGLGHVTDDLVALVRPSCRLVPDPSIDSAAAGASRLGGVPDLPPGTEWPTGPDAPLSFVAQINLADVAEVMPSSGLPASGLLAFFYDAVSQSAWGFRSR